MKSRNYYIFALASVTYAIKAQSLLKSQGISCAVIRTPKELGKGCGYSIKFFSDAERAAKLLKENNIEIKASYPKLPAEGGEGS